MVPQSLQKHMASWDGACNDRRPIGGDLRTLIVLVSIVVLALVIAAGWIPEGEAVEVVTFDHNGRGIETHLWIVDVDGESWVRAPDMEASWLQRVRRNPTAHLSRGDGIISVQMFPSTDPDVRATVNRAMQARYGRLERAYHWLRDPERTVPVQLVPIAEGVPGA